MTRTISILVSVGLLLISSCKNKKEKKADENFFPVIPIIRSQVAEVDTSLYSIRKITIIDSTTSDTIYCRREQFKELAQEFLALPDISSSEYTGRFKEENQYDETLNRAIISYFPLRPQDEVIQKQQVLIRPGPPDEITSIFIDYLISNRDSSVQKNMLWLVDNSFQVTTIRQLPGQKETTSTYKVIWTEGSEE
jgi:hypothetical protein